MCFYDRLQSLCERYGTKIYKVEKDLGFSKSSLLKYKSGGHPKMDRLSSIAEYFNVPVEYLISGEMPNSEDKGEGYYSDPEVKELAQFLFENPSYKVLFDAAKSVKADDMRFVVEMIRRVNGSNDGGDSN